MDNEAGVDQREKYRIRIYNHSTQNIKLEVIIENPSGSYTVTMTEQFIL